MQLEEKSKKILIICPHPEGFVPGQRLKFEQYYSTWIKSGYVITISSFMSPKFQKIVYKKGHLFSKILGTLHGYYIRIKDIFRIKNFDIVYIFLWVTPFGLPFFEYVYCLLAKKVVYDIDDLIYLKKTSPANKLISFLKSSKKPFFLIKKADHVLVSTTYLYSEAIKNNSKVTIIPATINLKNYPVREYNSIKKVVIGWSGSHTTSKYLNQLNDVLEILSNQFNIEIHIMGDDDFDTQNIKNIKLIKWSSDYEINALMNFDIGIHPVDFDDWSLGKSGGKLVQYMAASLPIVATLNEPNKLAIIDNETGFLVSTIEEWKEKLTLLITDNETRKKISIRSRKRAEKIYSIEANKDKYLNIFENL